MRQVSLAGRATSVGEMEKVASFCKLLSVRIWRSDRLPSHQRTSLPRPQVNEMKALAEIQVIPIGVGVSVRKEVKRAHDIIRKSGLEVRLHAYGTNVEGELDTILATVKTLHETLHAEGAPRLSTTIKIGTRTDKDVSLDEKLFDTKAE